MTRALVAPLLAADYIFLGPGSPSYAVRQLQDSYASRHALTARHRLRSSPLLFQRLHQITARKEALPIYEKSTKSAKIPTGRLGWISLPPMASPSC